MKKKNKIPLSARGGRNSKSTFAKLLLKILGDDYSLESKIV